MPAADFDDTDPPRKNPLLSADRELIEMYFAMGPMALLEAGMSPLQIAQFASRPEVQAYGTTLREEFKDARNLDKRRRFIAQRTLSKFLPSALRVIGQAISGPRYARDDDGNVVMLWDERSKELRPQVTDPAPTTQQVAASQDVLDRLGVSEREKDRVAGGGDMIVSLNYGTATATAKLSYDPDVVKESELALSRERRRTFIESVVSDIPIAAVKLQKIQNDAVRRKAAVVTSRTRRKAGK